MFKYEDLWTIVFMVIFWIMLGCINTLTGGWLHTILSGVTLGVYTVLIQNIARRR